MADNILLQRANSIKRDISLIPGSDAATVRKKLTLAQKLDDLIHFKRFGDCLTESYDDPEGAAWWSKFVSDDVQLPLKGTNKEYYASSHEILAIAKHGDSVAQTVLDHFEGDTQNLIVLEKGNGSRTAMINKTLVQLSAFKKSGLKTRLYVAREHSQTYRDEAQHLFAANRPDIIVLPQDVDFNKDDPAVVPSDAKDRERLTGLDFDAPRIVFEFGSSRSNIPTLDGDSIPYADLQANFAHDRKVCRKGGILIMATDCNQDRESLEGSFSHKTHAEFSKNIFRRGLNEGVLTDNLKLDLIDYYPRWDARRHLLKHTLVTRKDQSFKMYRKGQGYIETSLDSGKEYIYSHSFRWPHTVIKDAATANGFTPLATFWDDHKRVAIFIFKAT